MSQYYYRIFGVKFGPVSLELLQHEIASGQLLGGHEVRAENDSNWMSIADFVAQSSTERNPSPPHPADSTLTWDGGHDDCEITEVAANQVTKTLGLWFCRGSRVGRGPYNFDELIALARRQELLADDEVSLKENGPWTTVRSIGRLMAEIPRISPLLQAATNTATDLISQATAAVSAGSQLVSDDHLPVLSSHQPVLSDHQPVLSSHQPVLSSHQPVLSSHQPVLSSHQPVLSDDQPDLHAKSEAKTQWYVRMGQVEHGPIELQKMIDMVEAGRILPTDRVRESDKPEWTQAQAIPALFPANSKSNQSASTFSLKSVRPAIPVPQSYMKKGNYSGHVVPIPPLMPALVQQGPLATRPATSPAPTNFTIQRSSQNNPSATSPVTESRAGGYVQPTDSPRPFTSVQSSKPSGEPGAGGSVDSHSSSDQPFYDSSRKGDGESKHKLRRGQFKEPQLTGFLNWFIVAAASLLLFMIWRSSLAPDIEKFESPFSELVSVYNSLDLKRSENPTMELWAFARKEAVYKIESAKQKIKNINTNHPIPKALISLADRLNLVAKSQTSEDVTTHMEDARNSLHVALKEIREYKDQKFQKELQRKRSSKPDSKFGEERDER
jgi:GYF domain 2